MSLYGPCGNCWHSHGGVSPSSSCPTCNCTNYREASSGRNSEELEQLRTELESTKAVLNRRAEREQALCDALEYTVATIENVLPIVREVDFDDEAEGVEAELEDIRKLLKPAEGT